MTPPANKMMTPDSHRPRFWKRHWVKVAAWAIGGTVSYFVLYPMLLIAVFDMMVSYESMPSNLDAMFQYSVAPVVWLADICPPYESLLDWMDDLFPDR